MSAPTYETGGYTNITTATTTQVSPVPKAVLGVFVSTSTSGTFAIYDNASANTTSPVTGTVSAVAGTFYPLKAYCATGVTVVTAGTINCTVICA